MGLLEFLSPKDQPKNSPEKYWVESLTEEERRYISGLWEHLLENRDQLGGLDLSLSIVGSIARGRRNSRDIDLLISTSATTLDEKWESAKKADKILLKYLQDGQELFDHTGPGGIGIRYISSQMAYKTRGDREHNVRPIHVLFQGLNQPNMYGQAELHAKSGKAYVPLFSTTGKILVIK